jgi:DNA polymerase I-like protein with 3'-5' exonuclease and polymerase domains
VARDLWEASPKETKEHLKAQGFTTLDKYTDYIQRWENKFWNELFPEYAAWKKKIYRQYLDRGCIDTHTGFRFYGPMSRNEVTNFQTQGTACHILLFCLNELNDYLKERGFQSLIMGQIHDSIVCSIYPPEEKKIDKYLYYITSELLPQTWDWVSVPMAFEKSATVVDAPWSTMKEIGVLHDLLQLA